ncbi:MAG: site-specific integrase, partial [Patescibacteria group bacterium]
MNEITAQLQQRIHAILHQFAVFLAAQQLAKKSIRNYLSDIHVFLEWTAETNGKIGTTRSTTHSNETSENATFALADLEKASREYRSFLLEQAKPLSTINRHLASLRQFGAFLQEVHQIDIRAHELKNISIAQKSFQNRGLSQTINDQALESFELALRKRGCSQATIENYLGDMRQCAEVFGEESLVGGQIKPLVGKFLDTLRVNNAFEATIRRKSSTVRTFYAWAKQSEYIKANPFETVYGKIGTSLLGVVSQAKKVFTPLAFFERSRVAENEDREKANGSNGKIGTTRPTPTTAFFPRLYQAYSNWPVSSYLHLAVLVLVVSMIGVFGYQQFFQNAEQKFAFPTSLTRPNRVLSFQGRLTDSGGTPITVATNFKFRLFNHITNGTGDAAAMWASGTCAITPDQDGIFNSLLGSSCGPEIPPETFTENQNVYLEVQVVSETLTPRQQIATVGYALNAETLQGYPASASAVANTVPVFDNTGSLIIGLTSPTIKSNAGTFLLEGNVLSLATNTTTNGNIALAPDGTGQVSFTGGTTTQDFITVTNANLSTGKLINGTVGNNNTGYKFLSFTGGSTPSEKFYVGALGNVYAGNSLFAPVATISATNTSATPLIINGTGGQIFSIANSGNIAGAGTLTGLTGLTSSGTITFSGLNTAGAVAYTQSGGVLGVTAQGVSGYLLGSAGAGTPTWLDPATVGTNYWQLNNKVLAPGNITYD